MIPDLAARVAHIPIAPDLLPHGPRFHVTQGIFTVAWDTPEQVQLDFDLLNTDRRTGETHAELTVYLTGSVDNRVLDRTRINLLSTERRDRLAKSLGGRTQHLSLDWREMLETAVQWVLATYRAGSPAILLRDAPEPPGAGAALIPPVTAGDGSTIVFGDGASAKSYTALAFAASIHTGYELVTGLPPTGSRRVGFLDWEWSAHVHRRRLERLWPDAELPDLVYVACRLPLREERDRLRRIIRDHRLEYLVVDSVGLACGGDPQLPEVAIGFFAALRELELDALLVAHVTNAAARGSADRPFGSAYWHNSARATWYARAQEDRTPGHLSIGLYNKKANDGPLAPALSIGLTFDGDRTLIARGDVREVPDLAAEIPLKVRMVELLAPGALPMHEIVERLSSNIEAVKKAVQRDAGKRFVKLPGADGIYRIGLLQRGAA
jgi:hypothetical protein